MPVSAHYKPDPLFEKLGPDFADPVAPARFPTRILRRRNQRWAEAVGLDGLTGAEWDQYFARFAPLPGNQGEPLAMRYHGHQFRSYNPNIGDGRGFLFGQLRDRSTTHGGRLLDLATKGSGQTPYSRFGDGRLTLKGGMREILAAEMLEAQGVYTSRAFSLFETGEALTRHDEPSPTRSSVLVRLSHSHIRFGTFQRLAYLDLHEQMRALVEHAIAAYYPQHCELDGERKAAALFGEAIAASARLAASWMAAGFVHGVLNTDNLNITGESFDYGPWRFLPAHEPGFTAAYFDETGLYSFARQPEAVQWALAQLGGALTLIAPESALQAAFARFGDFYQEALRGAVFSRLGLQPSSDLRRDLSLLQQMFAWMQESRCGWDQFFHDWFCGAASAARAQASPQASLYAAAEFGSIRAGLEARTPERPERLADPYFEAPLPCSMLIHDVEGIWSAIAERDDWSPFELKLKVIDLMRAALALGGNVANAVTSAS